MHLRRIAGQPARHRTAARHLVVLTWLAFTCAPPFAFAQQESSSAPSRVADPVGRVKFAPRSDREPGVAPASSEFWWLGTAGVGLALAAFGWASLAARNYRSGIEPASLKVLSRASLGSKQAVSLVQVGERILIIGTGTQGAPSLLGEIDDAEEIARLTAAGKRSSATFAVPPTPKLAARPIPRGELA